MPSGAFFAQLVLHISISNLLGYITDAYYLQLIRSRVSWTGGHLRNDAVAVNKLILVITLVKVGSVSGAIMPNDRSQKNIGLPYLCGLRLVYYYGGRKFVGTPNFTVGNHVGVGILRTS